MLHNHGPAFHINRVIKYFLFADLFLFSGWGLVAPVFAIFVIAEIAGATVVHIGIGASIYWITKSIIQLPLAAWLDKFKAEKVPLYVLLAGLLITGGSAVLFVFIDLIWHFYVAQLIHAIGMAFYVVAWRDIYTHHLDKNRVAFEWALNSSTLGFASGITAFAGGYFASVFGFGAIFSVAAGMSFISALIIFIVPDLIMPPKGKTPSLILKDDTTKTLTY